jgi:basic membrane protein A
MKRVLLSLLLVALLSVGVASAQDAPFRVAMVMPSTITDLSWSQAMYEGLLAVQEELGGESALEIAYSESMFDVTAAAQAIRDYADDGYNLIIAHGTQYGTSLFEIAPDYPETSFAWGTATDVGEEEGLTNIFAYQAEAEQGAYVEGVIAAMMTETGKIGIIGPVPAGDALLYNNGFIQGVQATNPDIEILIAYTGSFGDTAGAAQIAQTQIAAGADVLTGSAQQVVGAIDAISAAEGYWFATQWDQSEQWPDAVVVSQVYDWVPALSDMIAQIQAGTLGGTAYSLTLENEGQTFVYGSVEVPEDVVAAADAAIEGIISGDIVVAKELEAEATPEATEGS